MLTEDFDPIVCTATSLGGPLAIQVGAELGARLIWLNRSSPDMNLFDRQKVLENRPEDVPKTRLMIVLGEWDEVYSMEHTFAQLCKLAKQNSDIFEEPLLLIQHGRFHKQREDDVASLASELVRPPFNCVDGEFKYASDFAKPGWPQLVRTSKEFCKDKYVHPRVRNGSQKTKFSDGLSQFRPHFSFAHN